MGKQVDFESKPNGTMSLMVVDSTVVNLLGKIGAERGLRVEEALSEAVTDYLVKSGYDPATGEKIR
jgi:hypothetical protein